jgi:glycine dehydrogenase subunit 1
LGKSGLQDLAELNYHKAHYAADRISTVPGFTVNPVQPFFNEFVVHCPKPAAEINKMLLEYDILGGYDLGVDYPSLKYELLVAVTEMTSKSEIDHLVAVLEEENHD